MYIFNNKISLSFYIFLITHIYFFSIDFIDKKKKKKKDKY